MSQSLVKVFQITEKSNPFLVNTGFYLAKSSGNGIVGFLLALGLGYIEALALRKNFEYTNFEYLHPFLETLNNKSGLTKLSTFLNKILEREIDQNEVAKEAKSSEAFCKQVIDFARYIFKIKDKLDSIYSIIQSSGFNQALSKLNIQLYIFSESELLCQIKKNINVHPLVIALLFCNEDEKFYNLYHKEYQIISEDHWNTSLEFFQTNESLSDNYDFNSESSLESQKKSEGN